MKIKKILFNLTCILTLTTSLSFVASAKKSKADLDSLKNNKRTEIKFRNNVKNNINSKKSLKNKKKSLNDSTKIKTEENKKESLNDSTKIKTEKNKKESLNDSTKVKTEKTEKNEKENKRKNYALQFTIKDKTSENPLEEMTKNLGTTPIYDDGDTAISLLYIINHIYDENNIKRGRVFDELNSFLSIADENMCTDGVIDIFIFDEEEEKELEKVQAALEDFDINKLQFSEKDYEKTINSALEFLEKKSQEAKKIKKSNNEIKKALDKKDKKTALKLAKERIKKLSIKESSEEEVEKQAENMLTEDFLKYSNNVMEDQIEIGEEKEEKIKKLNYEKVKKTFKNLDVKKGIKEIPKSYYDKLLAMNEIKTDMIGYYIKDTEMSKTPTKDYLERKNEQKPKIEKKDDEIKRIASVLAIIFEGLKNKEIDDDSYKQMINTAQNGLIFIDNFSGKKEKNFQKLKKAFENTDFEKINMTQESFKTAINKIINILNEDLENLKSVIKRDEEMLEYLNKDENKEENLKKAMDVAKEQLKKQFKGEYSSDKIDKMAKSLCSSKRQLKNSKKFVEEKLIPEVTKKINEFKGVKFEDVSDLLKKVVIEKKLTPLNETYYNYPEDQGENQDDKN